MAESEKPRKARKMREMNPVKLVLDRGTNMEKRWQPVRDEDGNVVGKEKVPTLTPKGVVLGPMQTMVLAGFINQTQRTIQTLEGIIDQLEQEDDDDDTDA